MTLRAAVRRTFFDAGVFLCLSAAAAFAGQSAASLTSAGIPSNCADFAAKVSSSEGNFGTTNQYGCVGAFQFCPGTFERYYNGSSQSFLNSPSAQTAAWTQYEQDSWSQAQKNGLTSLVGQQVCTGGKCATIDQSAILMACQFGCGPNGKLANYTAGGDCNARNVKDGNGVSVCTYLMRGAGYDASCFTGQKSNVCVQSPSGPGDYPTSTGIAANPPPVDDASVVVSPSDV
ncbi:acyltransferase [Roseiarcaceae bacterium H3SJ34-1]|uniref:acyltransferase n=1 Tax=Terripilifer ovatus TaxID=3032367 RepID=UPI003AB9362F|nr:acyltransferase [Roseiarcaceae bacterium H3SJ34-1]